MTKFEIAQFITRSDNFSVLLHDSKSGATAAIDAPDADPLIEQLKARGWTLTHILVTHKHFDHIEGIPALKAAYACEVLGPAASAAETGMYDRMLADGDTFDWGGAEVRVMTTPGHTLDHISYFLPGEKLVFVGDTIFSLGCGRVIEGDYAMMWNSLKRLRGLPDDTELYCGHEYTLANARFAVTIDPDNAALKARFAAVEKLRDAGKPTLPTTIGQEKATNPFLRADDPALMRRLGKGGGNPAEVFAEIRKRKDRV
jgi:hydroxyacylglutathione hydrolase